MGPWEVHSNFGKLTGKETYIVCRVKNEDEPVHSGNLVYADRGYVEDLAEAEAYAAHLNEVEASLTPCKTCGGKGYIIMLSPYYCRISCMHRCMAGVSSETLDEAVKRWEAMQREGK